MTLTEHIRDGLSSTLREAPNYHSPTNDAGVTIHGFNGDTCELTILEALDLGHALVRQVTEYAGRITNARRDAGT